MSVKLRNITGEPLNLGTAEGRRISDGEAIDVAGDVVEELDDAYLIGEGDAARAWPKATWERVGGKAKSTPDVTTDTEEQA